MHMGETIKKLRKESEMTQELLADYLNISYQAVSKWENGLAYPDITLIPMIARIFGVTIDYLFSMSEIEEEAFIRNFKEEYQHFSSIGDVESAISLTREALEHYPNNFYLLSELINKLKIKGDSKDRDEIITKSNLVINYCKDEDLKFSALQVLCLTYNDLGEKEKAIETAKKFPLFLNQERILRIILEGDEKIRMNQEIIFSALDDIGSALTKMSYKSQKEGNNKNSIDYLLKIIKIYEILFENRDYNFHHVRLVEFYMDLAGVYAKNNDVDNTMNAIMHSLSHGYSYDHLPEEDHYTSMSFNLLNYVFKETSINTTKSTIERIVDRLNTSTFDFIKDHDEFKKLLELYLV